MIKYKKPISIARSGRSLSFANPETGEVTTISVDEDLKAIDPTKLNAYAPAVALGVSGSSALGSLAVTNPYLAASLPAFAMSLPVALTVGSLGLGLYNDFTGKGRPVSTETLTRRFNDYTQDSDVTRVDSPLYQGRLLTKSTTEDKAGDQTEDEVIASSASQRNRSRKNRKKDNPPKDTPPTEEKSLKNTLKRSKELWNSLGRKVVGALTSPWIWVPVGTGAGGYAAYDALSDLDTIPKSPAQKLYEAVLDSIREDNIQRETLRLRDSTRNANTPRHFQFSDTTHNRQMLDSVEQLNLRRSLYGL